MEKFKSMCLAAMLAGFAGSAYGATLTATSTVSTVGDFTVQFTDANADGLLEFSEIDSFSGFSSELNSYDFLFTTPTLSGVSAFGSSNVNRAEITKWEFRVTGRNNVFSFRTSTWNYTLELDPTGGGQGPGVVPLPASLPLLAGALGFFGFLRRRNPRA